MSCAVCMHCGLDSRTLPITSICWHPDSKHYDKCVVGISDPCEYCETIVRFKKVKQLIKYVSHSCFDKSVRWEWRKSEHLKQLIQDAEKELERL